MTELTSLGWLVLGLAFMPLWVPHIPRLVYGVLCRFDWHPRTVEVPVYDVHIEKDPDGYLLRAYVVGKSTWTRCRACEKVLHKG